MTCVFTHPGLLYQLLILLVCCLMQMYFYMEKVFIKIHGIVNSFKCRLVQDLGLLEKP